jgi:hypothetical protein
MRRAILAIISLHAGLTVAIAQPAETASPPAANPETNSPVAMEEPLPGDHWTYEVRDEILGTVKSTRDSVVTEVQPKEISTRFSFVENSNVGSAVFDRSWNLISRGEWRHTPNDGGGVQLPLAVGKTWSFKSTGVNSKNGENWHRSGTSKVVAQESVTTKAGTFDTFEIQVSATSRNANNPTRSAAFASEIWYAPLIDHWVKRVYSIRVNGHLMENTSETLVAYGRKQP